MNQGGNFYPLITPLIQIFYGRFFIYFMDQQELGLFHLEQLLSKKKKDFWNNVLECHDTHGVPIDLIFLKLKEATVLPENFTAETLNLFLKTWRKMN